MQMKHNAILKTAAVFLILILCLSMGVTAMADSKGYSKDVSVSFVVTPDMLPTTPTPVTPLPTPVTTPSLTPVPTYAPLRPIVKTGDETPFAAIAVAAATSLLAAIVVYCYIRKKDGENHG